MNGQWPRVASYFLASHQIMKRLGSFCCLPPEWHQYNYCLAAAQTVHCALTWSTECHAMLAMARHISETIKCYKLIKIELSVGHMQFVSSEKKLRHSLVVWPCVCAACHIKLLDNSTKSVCSHIRTIHSLSVHTNDRAHKIRSSRAKQ